MRFTYPLARLLVVDDISTNLRVAEGLLAPYRAKIDTSLNGARAIELVKQNKYDIVFMDHMMPEMDGVEATAAIRAWEALTMNNEKGVGRTAVPIIALTANAVSGMKEMFIEKGFNDFLAKPIDISKLDEILARWIPKEKRGVRNEELGIRSETTPHSSLLPLPGVDIQHGIANTGGTIALYCEVLLSFCKDVEERLPVLQNVPEAAALPKFTTEVHALKSVSASMGASDISAMAAKLEAAGKASDIDFIRENLPVFTGQLVELVKEIEAWENAVKEGDSVSNGAELMRLLHELLAALETERTGDIDRILEELMQQTADEKQAMDAETKAAIEKISDNVLMAEFESATEIVHSLLNGLV
jgi:CheY-like chemotaxis protein